MNPVFDWHALAPDIVLVATIASCCSPTCFVSPTATPWQSSRIAAIGVLAALDPDRDARGRRHTTARCSAARTSSTTTRSRSRRSSSSSTYVMILLSVDYIDEGDYYQGEFYFLLLTSTLGMSVMASARDLITLFVALETISIPTFILAAFRKHDRESNEAGVKYYLIGVLSSALMLYGMSLIFGVTGSTMLSEHLGVRQRPRHHAAAPRRGLPVARRVRVQGQRGAVPLLGARHLRGRAHAGHRVPVGRVEGRRVRRAASTSSSSASTATTASAPTRGGPRSGCSPRCR